MCVFFFFLRARAPESGKLSRPVFPFAFSSIFSLLLFYFPSFLSWVWVSVPKCVCTWLWTKETNIPFFHIFPPLSLFFSPLRSWFFFFPSFLFLHFVFLVIFLAFPLSFTSPSCPISLLPVLFYYVPSSPPFSLRCNCSLPFHTFSFFYWLSVQSYLSVRQ